MPHQSASRGTAREEGESLARLLGLLVEARIVGRQREAPGEMVGEVEVHVAVVAALARG
jgi:hypothetical protein